MAKGQGSDAPLSWIDHVRLRSLHKHLHSRDHGVRIAAHKAMQAILKKQRGFRRRLKDRVLKPAARKVTPRPLHRRLGLAAPAPNAAKRGRATPLAPRMPRGGFRPAGGFGQTAADLKDRERMRNGRTDPQRAPAPARASGNGQPRQPDPLLRQAGLTSPARASAPGASAAAARAPSVTPQSPPRPRDRKQAGGERKWGGLKKRLTPAARPARTPAPAPDLTRMPADRVARERAPRPSRTA